MAENTENQKRLFLDELDKNTREELIRLDQKLKGLLAEINAKKDALNKYGDKASASEQMELDTFQTNLQVALEFMESISSMVVPDELDIDEFFETNKDMLNEFHELVEQIVYQVTQSRETL